MEMVKWNNEDSISVAVTMYMDSVVCRWYGGLNYVEIIICMGNLEIAVVEPK